MSRSGLIELDWGGEERRPFRLRIRELVKLQEKCRERGPLRIQRDIITGNWLVQDIVETIRLGLIGAGMPLPDADRLVREYVEERPLSENLTAAQLILAAAIVGPPIDEEAGPGGDPGEGKAATVQSTSPPSSEPAPSSASAPEKQAA